MKYTLGDRLVEEDVIRGQCEKWWVLETRPVKVHRFRLLKTKNQLNHGLLRPSNAHHVPQLPSVLRVRVPTKS